MIIQWISLNNPSTWSKITQTVSSAQSRSAGKREARTTLISTRLIKRRKDSVTAIMPGGSTMMKTLNHSCSKVGIGKN